MENIPDDPIIACIMRTGYPPWIDPNYISEDENDEIDEEDDYLEPEDP